MKRIIIFILAFIVIGCQQQNKNKSGFSEDVRLTKTIGNVTYYFPDKIDLKVINQSVEVCENSIVENLKLISETEFNDTIDVEFLLSRKEMKKYTGRSVTGIAQAERNTMFSLIGEGINPPIQHEMMHMITMIKWGTPPKSNDWINEGLATFAGGTCSNYKLEEIYTYYLQESELIGLSNLTSDFYIHPEMKSYTQSAYLCKYLIDNYGVDKIKQLWKGGFEKFREIYGIEYVDLEEEIRKKINSKYPDKINFDWEDFKKGC